MKKALIIASVYGFISSFEKSDINILQSMGYEVYCASNMSDKLGVYGDVGQMNDIELKKIQISFSRNPVSPINIRAYNDLKKLLNDVHFDLIHCHTPIAGAIARICANKSRKIGTRVIYTAHGFHFYKGSPKFNWIYYPVEYLCSMITDTLITINKEDFQLAKRKLKCKNVKYIPGIGLNTNKFENVHTDRLKKRKELGIPEGAILVLSVGELNKRKNHRTVIKALVEANDMTIFYVIAGMGKEKDNLNALFSSSEYRNNIKLVGHRKDIVELCGASDIFCFPSEREGLGIAALEAMAMCLPLVTSNIQGIKDYSIDNQSGYSCKPHDINAFKKAILDLAYDEDKRLRMGKFNKENVNKYDIENVRVLMKEIYEESTNE